MLRGKTVILELEVSFGHSFRKPASAHGEKIVCGIEHEIDGDNNDRYIGASPISREFLPDGAHMEPKITRLKKDGQEDGQDTTEGVEITLGGGGLDDDKIHQKAVITFLCNKEPKGRRSRGLDSRDDGKEGSNDDGGKEPYHKDWEDAKKTKDGAGGTIEFVAFKDAVLELEWTSPYACEDAISNPPKEDKEPSSDDGSDNGGSNTGRGWGFFSWFFFLIFLLFAGFLVFTAWVNYSRNGARGCDLLPFSDTLRDLPYILGDWWRKIASTLGGSGTRGGYSAV